MASRYSPTRVRSSGPSRRWKRVRRLGDRVENAAVHPRLRHPLLGRPTVAEEPFEDDPRVGLHRQRRRRRAPRQRIGVGAGVARIAVAHELAHVVDGQLERPELRLASHLVRDDLIDRRPRAQIGALGPLGVRRAQPGGAPARVVARPVPLRLRGPRPEPGEHHHAVAERLERLQDRGDGESGTAVGRREPAHDHAVGHVHEAPAGGPAARRHGPRRSTPGPWRRGTAGRSRHRRRAGTSAGATTVRC